MNGSKAVKSSVQAISLYFSRPITFTHLNELSNLTITQALHYRGISILQHLILPVHSSPTPLMQAPGQAHCNWIADGILLQQMQRSREVKCVCACVWGLSSLYGFCFFFFFYYSSLGQRITHYSVFIEAGRHWRPSVVYSDLEEV